MEIENPIKDIVDSIVDNIINHYSFIDYINQNSQKTKQGQWIKQYHKGEHLKPITDKLIRIVDLQNELVPIKQQFHHIQVHKQFVPNLCGYHATYNLIQCVQSIKYKITPQFYDAAAFWIYVKRTQDFLKLYRDKYIQENNAWPWRDSDIEGGDFERTYLKCCLAAKPLFKTTFQTEVFDGIKYHVTNDTIFYQYGNVVNGYNERVALQKKFDALREFKANNNEEMIQTYMLGVTNHWISFVAHKNRQGTHYVVMDSRNRDFFLWTERDIKQFLIQDNIERPQRGQKPLNQFYLDLYEQGMKDLQQLITLLVSWLSGQSNLESYVSNQKMKVFILPLIELLEINQEQFLNLRFKLNDAPNLYQILALWADQYRITVSEYIGNVTQITQLNKTLFLKSLELAQGALDYQTNTLKQQQITPLHKMVKCLRIIHQSL